MNHQRKRKVTAAVLACTLFIMAALPAAGASASAKQYKDLPANYWAAKALNEWSGLGIIQGYTDGTIRPGQIISRAEFAALMNRTFNFTEMSSSAAKDIPAGSWYSSDMLKALSAGYFSLNAKQNAEPTLPLTRAEAAVALDQIFKISAADVDVKMVQFTDLTNTEAATLASIKALAAQGYLKGFPDSTYRPGTTITRAELASVMDRMVDLLVNQAGTVKGGPITGNVVVNRAGAILTDTVIEGNLYLTEGISQGDVTLERVTVKGETFVRGGGENSIHIVDSTLGNVNVDKKDDKIRLVLSGTTTAAALSLNSKAKVELDAHSVIKVLNVSEDAGDSVIAGKGTIEKANNKAQGVKFNDGQLPAGSSAPMTSPPSAGTTPSDWTLKWSDEFNGQSLDPAKWDFDLGIGSGGDGWGNNELEYYTNRPENVKLENGNLVITGRKEAEKYMGSDYTSSRLVTRGKYAQKYGKIEVRASLPSGKGIWPAIWMLPENYEYGTWASSGEIDIMEAWGSKPDRVAGTLHYGSVWPDNVNTGKQYLFENGSTIEDYHTYAIEWEPGEIRWYVDGKLYSTQNDWYSVSLNQPADNAYPAPFDKEFHLLLNLAIGGNFDGNPDASTVFPKTMKVDYVRMYELTGRAYREPVVPTYTKEELPATGARQPLVDGNLVYNNNFDQPNETGFKNLGVENTKYWSLFQGEGGAGNVTVENIAGKNFAKVNITSAGNQSYSVQMLNEVSIAKGQFYKLSFKAKAAEERTMRVSVTGGESRGWAKYSRSQVIALSDQMEEHTMYFQMKQDTDLAARTEFNMGTNSNAVWIGDVRLERLNVDSIVINGDLPKKPLAGDGNRVYNGSFDQGDTSRMTYWHVNTLDGAVATGSVNEAERKLNVRISSAGNAAADSVQVLQKGIYLMKDQNYELTFDASADSSRIIEAALISADGSATYASANNIALTTTAGKKTVTFTMDENTVNDAQLVLKVGGAAGTIKLDNVKLIQTSVVYGPDTVFYPLWNGDFSQGLDGWRAAVDSGGAITAAENSGVAALTVSSLGDKAWSNMFIQEKLPLSGGITYVVSFEAQSTLARTLKIIAENSSYHPYFQQTVDLTTNKQPYSFEFKMSDKDTVDLKFLLGTVAETPSEIGNHVVTIDNVVFQVKGATVQRSPKLVSDTTQNHVGQPIEITFVDDPAWRGEVDAVKVNDAALEADQYTLEEGKLTLKSGVLPTSGNYTVRIEAAGYAFTAVKQEALPNPETVWEEVGGDLLANGTFDTDYSGWSIYNQKNDNEIWAGQADFAFSQGSLTATVNQMGWEWWHIQLYQEHIAVTPGKYKISFNLTSNKSRPVYAELAESGAPIKTFNVTPSQTAYEAIIDVSATGSFKFLLGLGKMKDDGTNYEVPQTLVFDNIKLVRVQEAASVTAPTTP
ncbi:carbohydrate binding domain-containing protein [Paenibacillus sp. sgz500958]|uniref:carbohydrate binding domain-containing protein n=1 Tax=Paenibacillus sp. sgz500958 TaxID=3242475 RepID=UPI0036D232EF